MENEELTETEKFIMETEKENDEYINTFQIWLESQQLSDNTIKSHVANIALFLNIYLIRYEAVKLADAHEYVSSFLGDWFIRKCLWSNKKRVKSTAGSIKKFYKCMFENNIVDESIYKDVLLEIKQSMDFYLGSVDDYNNGLYWHLL